MVRFQYTSFDSTQLSIRLVKIDGLESSHEAPRCLIETFQLSTLPPYKALSYTWGNPYPKSKEDTDEWTLDFLIFCNDQELRVHRNLWVDAVCINQDDVTERNSQVGLMPQIHVR